MNDEERRIIHCCYCTENLPDVMCDYCLAKRGVQEILYFPPAQEGQDLVNKVFDHYNIAQKTRLEILKDIEGDDTDRWFKA